MTSGALFLHILNERQQDICILMMFSDAGCHAQVVLKGCDHQTILTRVPESSAWHVMDVGFGSSVPSHPIALQEPDADEFTGGTPAFRFGWHIVA